MWFTVAKVIDGICSPSERMGSRQGLVCRTQLNAVIVAEGIRTCTCKGRFLLSDHYCDRDLAG